VSGREGEKAGDRDGYKKGEREMRLVNNFFGEFGGRYVAEILNPPLEELKREFLKAMEDDEFKSEFESVSAEYTGRPTPLLFAENTTRMLGGGRIFIKLEGLANTGAHKINNVLGQLLLAKRMGKRRIIAETGAGQHGLATAALSAKFGFKCRVYMGKVDIERQRPNVFWMELYGAEVVPVEGVSGTLKDAVNEALRDWASSFEDTHYLLGSALGPSPYPDMVREFQSVIGKETKKQMEERGEKIEALVACVGGGSNSIGFFYPWLSYPWPSSKTPRLIGVEAGGSGDNIGEHAARMSGSGRPGIVHGYKSLFLLDDDGQVTPTHSVSAGLDYPGIGPQLAQLGKDGRIEFTKASDEEALTAVKTFAKNEGIVFALESAHAGAAALKLAPQLPKDRAIVINMSGRGDKDLFILAERMDRDNWHKFLRSIV